VKNFFFIFLKNYGSFPLFYPLSHKPIINYMTAEEYTELYERYLAGKATPQEIERLLSHQDKFDIAKFDTEERIVDQDAIKIRIYDQIVQRANVTRPGSKSRKFLWPVAASLLLLSTAGIIFVKKHHPIADKKVPGLATQHHTILPGTNKAILILGNGETIDLREKANGQIARAGNVRITKVGEGRLVYDKGTPGTDAAQAVSFNTIVIPKGGQYEVTLPDGTSVWLNSASSLKYPTVFTGKERHVELTGEAYFEVTKNKARPFTVSTGKVDVRVLGTHFNIAAYPDDPASKTTLLEGAVVLSNRKQQLALIPGQQGIATADNQPMELKTVNMEDAIAWKKGYFSFRKENIESAMRKIARWYDVDVAYQGKMSRKILGGSVSRTQDIDEILAYIELTGIAHFELKGRRIIVRGN
jgi:hypothetical protein